MRVGPAAAMLVALVAMASAVAATTVPEPSKMVAGAVQAANQVATDPVGSVQNPQPLANQVLDPQPDKQPPPGAPKHSTDPGFADRIRAAFDDQFMMAGVATAVVSVLGIGGFALVTRYVSPKEALKNPQRAMLYGFVRGNPGVHLKKLSEEFAMKTSSILWHIRKLENAELVRSERANGFRVFYPVDGGIEIKRVSRAITALQNGNARVLYEAIERRGGVSPTQLAQRLAIHGGTVRWHLRKLRDFGLVEELVREEGSTFYPTPLGRKALQTMVGTPVTPVPAPASPVPVLAVPIAAE